MQKPIEGKDEKANEDVPAEEKLSREELIKRLRKYQGMIPADIKFDRDEANSRVGSSFA